MEWVFKGNTGNVEANVQTSSFGVSRGRHNAIAVHDGFRERFIGLYEADLSQLMQQRQVDILVVPVFPEDDMDVGVSFDDQGLSLGEIWKTKRFDMSVTSGFWACQALVRSNPDFGPTGIVCYQPRHFVSASPQIIGDFFRGLYPYLNDKRQPRVGLPTLVPRKRRRSMDAFIRELLQAAMQWMRRGYPISELMIAERDADTLKIISGTMEDVKRSNPATRAPMERKAKYDWFISYATPDKLASAIACQELLTRHPAAKVFDFRYEIDQGSSWQTRIDEAIAHADKILAIMSPDYFASPECIEELMMARLRDKRSQRVILLPYYWKSIGTELDLWLQVRNYWDCREANADKLRVGIQELNSAQESR
jgi:hypothetical protein